MATKDNQDLTSQSGTQMSEREDLRIIPKSKIQNEHFHEIYLLDQPSTFFVKAEVTDLIDSFEVKYHNMDKLSPFSEIKNYTKDTRLRYLINLGKLEELQHSRYTYQLSPKELYFTENGIPKLRTRGLKGVVAPLELSEEEFLIRYKALIICAFNNKANFTSLVEGNLPLHKGTDFENQIIKAKDLSSLKDVLQQHYEKQKNRYRNNFKYVNRNAFNIFKWLAIAASIAVIGLVAYLLYLNFAHIKKSNQIEKGYQSFVKEDYSEVISDYKNLNGKKLNQPALYIYAKSYVETNKQGLEKDKKHNLLNNISPKTNKDYLLYWFELGHGNFKEALNIATYLDDNDITKLALINKLNEIKNNPKLSNDDRSKQTKKYNDKLQDIIDKEKKVKEDEDKKKEKAEKEKEEERKQQEENEKKQKKQEQDDKKKQREAERKK